MKIGEFVNTFEFKTKPDKHQLDCFKFGLLHNRFLLGDEQGLGKTKESIDLAVAKKILYGYKHCLIISCVASLRYIDKFETIGLYNGCILKNILYSISCPVLIAVVWAVMPTGFSIESI